MWVWGSTSHLPINGVPEMSRGLQLEEDLVQEQDRASGNSGHGSAQLPRRPQPFCTPARPDAPQPPCSHWLWAGAALTRDARGNQAPRARSGPQHRP